MRKEDFDYVLGVLQETRETCPKAPDWYGIVGFLELNRVAGYFYCRAKEQGIRLPQGVERRLYQTLRVQKERNLLMRAHIQQISDALKARKIPFAFLKGSVLSNANLWMSERAIACAAQIPHTALRYREESRITFYGLGERVSNDIDILVRPEDLGIVAHALKDMGFVQGTYDASREKIVEFGREEILLRRMNRGETAPFLLKSDCAALPFVEVDVNFSLDHLPSGNTEAVKEFLSDAFDYAGPIRGGIPGLSRRDFFLHLIAHQYKESTQYSMVLRNKDTELYKLLDLYLFLKRGYVGLDDVRIGAKKYNLERETYSVLGTLSQVFGGLKLEGVLKNFCPSDAEEEKIHDPATNARYVWKKNLLDRFLCYEKSGFLKEAER